MQSAPQKRKRYELGKNASKSFETNQKRKVLCTAICENQSEKGKRGEV